jgi:hypothetical protein
MTGVHGPEVIGMPKAFKHLAHLTVEGLMFAFRLNRTGSACECPNGCAGTMMSQDPANGRLPGRQLWR